MMKNMKQPAFVKKAADLFMEAIEKERGSEFLKTTFEMMPHTAPIEPVVVNDHAENMSVVERNRIIQDYHNNGYVYVISLNHDKKSEHPIFGLVDNLKEDLKLYYPYSHPAEGHPEAVRRFGEDDKTFKIYDLPDNYTKNSFREIAETHESFDVHLDGLGTGGTVQTLFLYADSTPVFGGYGFIYDIFSIAIAIYNKDPEAFQSLFQPDAITSIRPRGKGAIKIVSPVLYIDVNNEPRAFYRKDSGEYKTEWCVKNPALTRAREYLSKYTESFCPASKFAPYTKNSFLIIRNRDIAHARTSFIDGKQAHERRLISGKWYMINEDYQALRHIPGTAAASFYQEDIGDQFSDEYLEGFWLYDQDSDVNVRVK